MPHSKSGIPRPKVKRKADACGGSKTSNERSECRHTVTTDAIKNSHVDANSDNITDCSKSSTAQITCKTMISTRATKSGRHCATSSKESLPTNSEVGGGNYSDSANIKPTSRRTFISVPPTSRAKNLAVTDMKTAECRHKGLPGALQVVPNTKSRRSSKILAMPLANGLLQPNQLSFDHGRKHKDQKCENGRDVSCQSLVNHETTSESEAESLNRCLQLFVGETKSLTESLNKEITLITK